MVTIDGEASVVVGNHRDRLEKDFQKHVLEVAETFGWDWHHETDSTKSKAGFPDLVMWNTEPSRLLIVELKTDKGRLSKRQKEVIGDLGFISQVAGFEVYIWRPKQWDLIVQILKVFSYDVFNKLKETEK